MNKNKTFEALGGRVMLEKIAKVFYDKVYQDEWLGLYFQDVPQDVIESQQVDFMTQALGGGKTYLGKLPIPAHKHMFITEDLFETRHYLLMESLNECKADSELMDRWIKIEDAFKNKLIKKNIDECEKRFKTDEILDFPKPKKNVA